MSKLISLFIINKSAILRFIIAAGFFGLAIYFYLQNPPKSFLYARLLIFIALGITYLLYAIKSWTRKTAE